MSFKNTSIFFITAVLLIVFLPAACSRKKESGSTSPDKSETEKSAGQESGSEILEGYKTVTEGDFRFSWSIDGENLKAVLEAPTEGWVAVGFDPTNMMQDANLILGYVKEGEVTLRDDYGTWLTSHADDVSLGGTDNITPLGGEEVNGRTRIEFSIPLDSGDENDRTIEPGKEYDILFAFGANDDFSGMHRKKTKTKITF